jgi:hypothetical protein
LTLKSHLSPQLLLPRPLPPTLQRTEPSLPMLT